MYCKHCGQHNIEGAKFCKSCGVEIATAVANKRKGWKKPLKITLVVIAVLIAITFYALSDYTDSSDTASEGVSDEFLVALFEEMNPNITPIGFLNNPTAHDDDTITDQEWLSNFQYYDIEESPEENNRISAAFPNQEEVLSAVVKIVCESSDGDIFLGSGTNDDPNGYILTNEHVVYDSIDGNCVVGFPNPKTGLIEELYWATPIIDDDEVNGHDLALLSIEEPLIDEDSNVYGYVERTFGNDTFPYFEQDDKCFDTAIELGSRIFVIGYPRLSGGALTITDGIVSSLFSQDGYIITSAKIISGNSGGLAIDENGCHIGVPTAVYYEEGEEYLGEIIDAEFVYDFYITIEDELEEYYKSNLLEN